MISKEAIHQRTNIGQFHLSEGPRLTKVIETNSNWKLPGPEAGGKLVEGGVLISAEFQRAETIQFWRQWLHNAGHVLYATRLHT